MEQIRYLKQQEKQNTRAMYEAIFSEDSHAFVDYYYQWKTRDNEIIVLENEKGYEVMMHLNPYSLRINGRTESVPYIVAVATRPDCRRRGKMQQTMMRALQDMQRVHCPFTFLMPANSAYYEGQGFVFAPKRTAEGKRSNTARMPEQKELIVCEGARDDSVWNCFFLKSGDDTKVQQAAEAANEILAEQYDMYVQRDAEYYERLVEETAAELGGVLLIEVKNKCIGVLSYGKGEQAEIKEFLIFHQYQEQKKEICNRIFGRDGWEEEEMRMMFRITDLQALDGMLKGEQEVLKAVIEDHMIEENNGIWQIEWNPDGGSVTRLSHAGGSVTRLSHMGEDLEKKPDTLQGAANGKVVHMDIAELTEKMVEKMSIFIREWV